MSLTIRSAGVEDIPIIQHLAHLIWPDAYWNILSGEQLSYMLDLMYNRQVLQHQLEQEAHRFFIAENGSPVGFAGASPYNYHLPGQPHSKCWKLHKLYVLPYIQKTGAGKALMQQIISTARADGATTLILNVNRNNPALDYYLNHGFSIIETGDFDIGAGFYMKDYIMAKNL